MKLRSTALPTIVTVLALAFSCNAQNGPTQPSVTLTWTQSTGSTNPISKNCVYRGTATGVYSLPALFCSTSPVTTYKDTTVVRGTQYFYVVTAQDTTGAESGYSNEVGAKSPVINSPTGLGVGLLGKLVLPNIVPRKPMPVVTASKDGRLRAVAE